jgi:hypothetical protein
MGTTLTGTTPQDTYDSLIKVTDNGPLSGTAKYLSDGLGNDSALALSTSRVGIGTASPNYKLEVSSAADTDTTVVTTSNSNSALLSTFNSHASSGNFLQLRSYGAGTSGTIFGNSIAKANMLWSNVDNLFAIGTIGATPLIFGTENAERMRITSAGLVGIGTSEPAEKLDVYGNLNFSIPDAVSVSAKESLIVKINSGNDQSNRVIDFRNYNTSLFTILQAGNVGIGTSSPAVKLEVSGGDVRITSASAPRLSLNNTSGSGLSYSLFSNDIGKLVLGRTGITDDLIVTSAGPVELVYGQLKFPATQVASADANTLDDYEEGTWTPIVNDLTNEATMISGTTGFYTKIGRQVTLSGYVRTTSIGSVSGDVYIGGMPFTSNGSLGSETSVTFGYFTAMNLGAAGVSVGAYIVPATTRMALYINDVATGITAMQGSEWGNTGYVHLGITYFV